MSEPQPAVQRGGFDFDEVVQACDVCEGRDFATIDAGANIVQCQGCGFRFVNPRPSQKQIAASYSESHFYDGWLANDAGRVPMWRKRLALLERRAGGRRLLDVGAGIGTFLWLARAHGWDVAGTEVSTSARQLARQRYEIDLQYGPAKDLALPASAYDVVTLWHVLEHVPSPSSLLKVCHDALVPGGFLVLAVPNDSDGMMLGHGLEQRAKALLGRRHALRRRYERLAPGLEIHLSHFTLPVLDRLFRQEGFHRIWVTLDDHYPNPSWKTDLRVGAYRLIHRLSGMNLGEAMLVMARRS